MGTFLRFSRASNGRLAWCIVVIVVITVLRESGAMDFSLCSKLLGPSGTTTIAAGGRPAFEDSVKFSYQDDHLAGGMPQASPGEYLVVQYVASRSPLRTWLPLYKNGTVQVIRVFRIFKAGQDAMYFGSQITEMECKVVGLCSHRQFIQAAVEEAQRQFQGNLVLQSKRLRKD